MPDISSISWPVLTGGLLLYAALVALAVGPGRQLLPPQRQRAVPWSGLEIIAVLFLFMFWPSFVSVLLTETRLGEWIYGSEVMTALGNKGPDARLARERVGLLIKVLALPLQVASIPLFLYWASRTRPYQLGLTGHRAGRNVALGVLGCLLLTPLVYGVNWLATEGFSRLTPDSVTPHPFEQLSRSGTLTGVELGLVVFLAVVGAPVAEELLFRRVLLGWMGQREWGGHVAMVLAFLAAVPGQPEKWQLLLEGAPWQKWVLVLAPALFVLLMVPGYLCVCARQETPFPAALYGTSLLFGIMHGFAWPSPVPLFVLALGLGWLMHRTQSLAGPIVLHSLFNGVACVQLLQAA